MNVILALIQLSLSVLVNVSHNPAATVNDKKRAISEALHTVQLAQQYLSTQNTVIAPITPQIEPIQATSTDWYHSKWASGEPISPYVPKKLTDPLVYLEANITEPNGEVKLLKGINRDAVLKELSIKKPDITEQNPYYVKGAYATSTTDGIIEVSIFVNNPDNLNYSCVKTGGRPEWTGTLIPQDHTETFHYDKQKVLSEINANYDYYGNYIKYVGFPFGVRCTSTSTNTWYQEIKHDYWDMITIDFVK